MATMTAPVRVNKRKVQKGMTLTPKLGPGLGFGLGVVAFYFFVPIISSFEFSIRGANNVYSFEAYTRIPTTQDFGTVLALTGKLALVTIILSTLIMVPTVTLVHLTAKKFRRVVEFISLLPLVIPPVVLVLGVLASMPVSLKGTPYLLALEYVMLSMPYTFRALDAGLGAIDVRTLVDASRGLGAPWRVVFVRVIAPNIRSAIFGSIFLTLALVLGEYTMAALMLWNTFPTWIALVGQQEATLAVALSIFSLVFAWLLLLALSAVERRQKARL
jgi:putative spermidine/putrescine transport system permease protein